MKPNKQAALLTNSIDEDAQSLLAVGHLIVDHTFLRSEDSCTYLGSRGGGSISNIAWNFQRAGGRASLVSEINPGLPQNVAVDDLKSTGCNVYATERRSVSRTQAIFHTILPTDTHNNYFSHKFSLNCPCEREHRGFFSSFPFSSGSFENAKALIPSHRIFCADRLVKDNVALAQIARQLEKLTALDLGRASPLRYFSTTRLASYLEPFDLVLMPIRVWKTIHKRIIGVEAQSSNTSEENSLKDGPVQQSLLQPDIIKIGTVSKAFQQVGINAIFLVTDGPNTIRIFDCRNEGFYVELPPYDGPVKETSGAGDAFLGRLLFELSSANLAKPLKPENIVEAVKNITPCLGDIVNNFGARGISSQSNENLPISLKMFIGLTTEEIREQITGKDCPFCGAKGTPKVITKNARVGNVISRRVDASLYDIARVLEYPEQIEHARAWIRKLSGSVFVVGSGGSHSVAQYIAYTLNHEGKDCFAVCVHPIEYLRLNRRSDAVIVVSYSGKTLDCKHVIEKAKLLKVGRIGLVTGVEKPLIGSALRQENDAQLSFFRSTGLTERGFVSILGTLGPCVAWCAAQLSDPLKIHELLKPYQISESIRLEIGNEAAKLTNTFSQNVHKTATPRVSGRDTRVLAISIFGSGCAVPAMIDLESKFTEGNLGWIRIHDEKDFSHGRFMSVLTDDHVDEPALLFRSGEATSYTDKLEKVLKTRNVDASTRTAVLQTQYSGALGALDLLIKTQLLVRGIALSLKIDIARPGYDNIPRAGLTLYHWKAPA